MSSRISRSNRDMLDAIVVGAGMVGAAAALGLARAGMRVAVLEHSPVQAPAVAEPLDLRVVALAPHAIGLLTQLGVWGEIAAVRVSPYEQMRVVDGVNGSMLSFCAADYGWPALGMIVENRLVAGSLWQALEREAGVAPVLGQGVDKLRVDSELAQLDLSDGRVLKACLLIIADGARSPLRERLLIGTDARDYGQSGLVAHIEIEKPHQRCAWQRFLPSGPLALLPLADGRVSMVWTLPSSRAAELAAVSAPEFESQLQRASADHYGAVRLSSDRQAFPLQRQIAQRFVSQRALLLGDAAHVVHPLAGQGVNLGFEDVSALLEMLGEAGLTPSQSALERYARARRSEATLAAHAFDRLNSLYSLSDGPLVLARGLGLRLVDRLTPLKRRLAERAAGIRAGS